MKTVVIIGGGITGLSTAYYLQKYAKELGTSLRLVLLEEDTELGGKIRTDRFDGFVVELGPDSFLARKTAALDLIGEIGLDEELVGTNPAARKTYILHQGTLHRIPAGLNIGVPTQFMPFATTKLLSFGGKLRAGLDFLLPRSKQGDQSLGAFLERRLGPEVVDHIAEPLLAGIYAGDLRKLSLRATFPQFEALEQKYGSLVRGMLAQAKQAKSKPRPAATGAPGEVRMGIPNSVFLSFRGGLKRLVERLQEVLEIANIQTGVTVEAVRPLTLKNSYEVKLTTGESFEADAVVVTTPTYDAFALAPDPLAAKETLKNIPYVSVATVVLGFAKSAMPNLLDGSGFVVPRKEARAITACTWVSSKWSHTAPDDAVLLRCYVGRSGDEHVVERPDDEILALVLQDLSETMNVNSTPLFTRITRWKKAMPQYTVGHLERIQEFQEQTKQNNPGLLFGGAGYTGLGIPDCIAQGVRLAQDAFEYLKGIDHH